MTQEPEKSNVTNETVQQAQREYAIQRRKCDEENGVLRSILKKWKVAGVNTKALIATHQDMKLDPTEVAKNLHDHVRYLALRSFPKEQLPLFSPADLSVTAKAEAEQQAFAIGDAGYKAGIGGVPRDDNPHAPGSESNPLWDLGWADGMRARQTALGTQGKPADATRKRKARTEAPAKRNGGARASA
jgi:hypothetical protein